MLCYIQRWVVADEIDLACRMCEKCSAVDINQELKMKIIFKIHFFIGNSLAFRTQLQ